MFNWFKKKEAPKRRAYIIPIYKDVDFYMIRLVYDEELWFSFGCPTNNPITGTYAQCKAVGERYVKTGKLLLDLSTAEILKEEDYNG